ncbi:MAG: hypothetical protein HC859_01840 [Bacteroidia bacterium]|nr:hypothetical protein [Bacteroidia bacterium]
MDFIVLLLFVLGWTAFVLLVAGLFKPWVVLWWEDVQNRKKVIQIYGTIMGGCFLLGYIVRMVS